MPTGRHVKCMITRTKKSQPSQSCVCSSSPPNVTDVISNYESCGTFVTHPSHDGIKLRKMPSPVAAGDANVIRTINQFKLHRQLYPNTRQQIKRHGSWALQLLLSFISCANQRHFWVLSTISAEARSQIEQRPPESTAKRSAHGGHAWSGRSRKKQNAHKSHSSVNLLRMKL